MNARCVSQKGQLSLEFLLVMAGFVLALALFAPVALKSAKAALFAMEIQRAQEFLSEFKSEASQVSFLADGTVKEVKANALKEWLFEAGVVAIGTIEERECFSVTPFGCFFFAD